MDDPVLAEALRKYHQEGISSNSHIQKRLYADTGIVAGSVCYLSRTLVTSPLSLQRDSFITPDLDDFFSALTLNLAFLPRKLMVSHTQEIL